MGGGGGEGGGGFQKLAVTAQPNLQRLVIDIQNTNIRCQRYFSTLNLSPKIVAKIVVYKT